jgi:hypothetical protein
MKNFLSKTLLMAALATAFVSCKDNCVQTVTYRGQESVKVTLGELRSGIKTLSAQELENPGKIYIKDNYLFINEIKKGIHVVDNTNPTTPKIISFIQILGNVDIAVKDNVLFADSYTDFVALDISNPKDVKEISRTKDVFINGQVDGLWWSYNTNDQTIYDSKYKIFTTTQEVACETQPNLYYGPYYYDVASFAKSSGVVSTTSPTSTGSGTGGSSARFTIVDDRLYAVTQSDMKLFNIKNPSKPTNDGSVNLGFGIETIFPYKNMLFLGTTTGVQIWDNSNTSAPKYI